MADTSVQSETPLEISGIVPSNYSEAEENDHTDFYSDTDSSEGETSIANDRQRRQYQSFRIHDRIQSISTAETMIIPNSHASFRLTTRNLVSDIIP